MKTFLIVVNIYCLIFITCNKDNPIVNNNSDCSVEIEDIVQYEDINCNAIESERFIENNENSYNELIGKCDYAPSLFPTYAVDFSKYTVLGLKVSGSGCARTFDASLSKCDEDQSYTYLVTINEFGNCEPLETRYVIAKVPKIEDAYEVFFENTVIKNP